jgi:exodeoxyribonuclease-5
VLELSDLSEDQDAALNHVGEWFQGAERAVVHCDDDRCAPYEHTHGGDEPAPVFALGGVAGTGKTTVMRWLEAKLACQVSYGVPTHKAARVLRAKLDAGARERVSTFHSLVFYPNARFICSISRQPVREVNEEGGSPCECGDPSDCGCVRRFTPCERGGHTCTVEEQLRWEDRPYLRGHLDLLVLDESSMVSAEDVERIRAFGVPLLLVGDHGQLPPVKAVMNPWTQRPDVELTVNHRQANDTSGIVDVALELRGGGKPSLGSHGDGRTLVVPRAGAGVSALLTPERYRGEDRRRPTIICPWNKLRANVNLRFHGDGPVRVGDEVVALSRSMVPLVRAMEAGKVTSLGDSVAVHNGQVGVVVAVTAMRSRTCDLVVDVEDVGRVLVANVALAQFGRATQLALNERPFGARLWDYAYAITAHKAQGSEWSDVLVLEESPQDYARWMYTAVTRARERLIVVRY